MNIKELKKELNLSNSDLAKCFDMTYGAYANSTAKERYENALLNFYKLAKKGWKKNKRKNLISDNQTIKHEPKPLIIHGVVSSLPTYDIKELEELVENFKKGNVKIETLLQMIWDRGYVEGMLYERNYNK